MKDVHKRRRTSQCPCHWHPRGNCETHAAATEAAVDLAPVAYHFMSFFRLSLYDLMSPSHTEMPPSTTQISRATCDSRRKS